jgi:hypothetical protein
VKKKKGKEAANRVASRGAVRERLTSKLQVLPYQPIVL